MADVSHIKLAQYSHRKTLFVMIFMAGIGLIISIVALLYLSLHLISTKTNEIDEHRTALSVQGRFRHRSTASPRWCWITPSGTMRCGRPTAQARYQWLYNTWGAGFKINNLYDGTFVLDEHFNVMWGSFQSQPFTETNLDFLGTG
jgi:hypothetical protein